MSKADISDDILPAFFKKHALLNSQTKIAIAVSGGPDSMALAHALIQAFKDQNKEIYVLSVDHGLRAQSKDEVQMVARWAEGIKQGRVRHHVLNWEGEKPQSAVLETARAVRYDLMRKYCMEHDIPALFLGHHQDDQAETFLIRLSKGSGLDGLAGMLPVCDIPMDGGAENGVPCRLYRPFLEVSKKTLVAYCKDYEIPFTEDPTNKDEAYLRPRLRAVIDVLGQEGLSAKRLSVTTKRIARARQALEQMTRIVYQDCVMKDTATHITFDYLKLREWPEEIGLRVLQTALENFKDDVDYPVRMERLENLFESLWYNSDGFKPRTLGGGKIYFQKNMTLLCIEREHIKTEP